MKIKLQRFFTGIVLASIMLFLISCENENSTVADGKAKLQFKLTDAPSLLYDEVNIDIQGLVVGVYSDFNDDGTLDDDDDDFDEIYDDKFDDFDDDLDDDDDFKWVKFDVSDAGLYNLLDYRNGETVLLAGGEVPAGKITQVRLLLGPNSNVVIDGVTYPLTTPSAKQSGLKFNLHETLVSDMMYSFTIDFDAARSVVRTGNGKYILKPVIRTFADAFGGTIRGVVLPAEAFPYVQLVKGTDTLISLPETDGKFLFPGLAGGAYNLTIFSDTLGYKDTLFLNVPVVQGEITNLGTITLLK